MTVQNVSHISTITISSMKSTLWPMMTDKQKETFQKLKDGKLNPKQKADFYYRMSKILKEELERITDITSLLDELPNSYLEKIDLRAAASTAMGLTEKLTEMLDPSPFAARDKDGKYHVFRHFRVDMSGKLRGVTQATADIDVIYEPTEEEVLFFRELTNHITKLEEMYLQNERPNELFTSDEFEKKVASIVKGRPYTAKVIGMFGSPTEETAKNIMDGKSLNEAGLPNLEDVDIGLKGASKEELPK